RSETAAWVVKPIRAGQVTAGFWAKKGKAERNRLCVLKTEAVQDHQSGAGGSDSSNQPGSNPLFCPNWRADGRQSGLNRRRSKPGVKSTTETPLFVFICARSARPRC